MSRDIGQELFDAMPPEKQEELYGLLDYLIRSRGDEENAATAMLPTDPTAVPEPVWPTTPATESAVWDTEVGREALNDIVEATKVATDEIDHGKTDA